MHLHILGICGTFMGGLALLARELGHRVTGQDLHVYPPMSTMLAEQGVEIISGYDPMQLPLEFSCEVDLIIVGNAMSRGNPMVEWLLNRRIPYTSGPQWLAEQLLYRRWVIAVAGTHGKTSTTAMIATILEAAGFNPGFLIGGVANNFPASARLGSDPFFVIEADEYDTAFFDKRSKFLHYHPQTLILNNLEYDHADIFPDLAAIVRQFQHLLRIVPGLGKLIAPADDVALQQVIGDHPFTAVERIHSEQGWSYSDVTIAAAGERLTLRWQGEAVGELSWQEMGAHNRHNALMAIAAAHHAGIPLPIAIAALGEYRGVKRRMELRGEVAGVRVYDDFAHHPTAIRTTIAGLRARMPAADRLLLLLEACSNTMRLGVHGETLVAALAAADLTFLLQRADMEWQWHDLPLPQGATVCLTVDDLVTAVMATAQRGDHLLVMSNGDFGGVHQRLLNALQHDAS
ncbi:MAG: UDP-N-acetylmuramate:L-alanyl-gamma-D-glutamyl-meso-diaminopimelate ligase [Gammaproteobacteria bacterium]|nr:UDP-N-acetylmuramate:L-alanyl-gamma-D-glutamyl-meso-diaminopimelate ligase [Gammaproteobacteria bacterium]